MLTFDYDRANCRLRLSGHAGSGPKGEDLVCAGVSTLACTLAASVEALGREGKAEQVRIVLRPGFAEIRCVPRDPAAVRGAFDTVYRGLELLARNNRKFVRKMD